MENYEAKVTIVLLTHNSEQWIRRTVEHLLSLNIPILAVDNASNDATCSLLEEYSEIRLIKLAKNYGAYARNIGVEFARTPYVAFCDDDTWWRQGSIEKAVAMMEEYPTLGLVNAKIFVGPSNYLDPVSEEMSRSPLADTSGIPGHVLLGFMAGACVVRSDAFMEVGGYRYEMFMGGEEEDVAWKFARMGWDMRYVPTVVAHHYPSLQNAPNLQHYGIRNTLWTAWLHRPIKDALSWSLFVIKSSPKNMILLKGIAMTIPGCGWIIRNRRVVTPFINHQLRLLDFMKKSDKSPRQYGLTIKKSSEYHHQS